MWSIASNFQVVSMVTFYAVTVSSAEEHDSDGGAWLGLRGMTDDWMGSMDSWEEARIHSGGPSPILLLIYISHTNGWRPPPPPVRRIWIQPDATLFPPLGTIGRSQVESLPCPWRELPEVFWQVPPSRHQCDLAKGVYRYLSRVQVYNTALTWGCVCVIPLAINL